MGSRTVLDHDVETESRVVRGPTDPPGRPKPLLVPRSGPFYSPVSFLHFFFFRTFYVVLS